MGKHDSEAPQQSGGKGGGGDGGNAPQPSYKPMPVIPSLIQEERRGVQLIPGQESFKK